MFGFYLNSFLVMIPVSVVLQVRISCFFVVGELIFYHKFVLARLGCSSYIILYSIIQYQVYSIWCLKNFFFSCFLLRCAMRLRCYCTQEIHVHSRLALCDTMEIPLAQLTFFYNTKQTQSDKIHPTQINHPKCQIKYCV